MPHLTVLEGEDRFYFKLAFCSFFLIILMVASLHFGAEIYTPYEVWNAFWELETEASIIIQTLRVPRMVLAPVTGMALALSGLLLQTVSGNPLASPAFLGVNSGAAFFVLLAFSFFGFTSLWFLSLIAFAGALTAISLVFLLAFSFGASFQQSTLLLAGITLSSFLSSAITILLATNETTLEALLFWLSGSFANRDMSGLIIVVPVLFFSIIVTLIMKSSLDSLLMDDESAKALGLSIFKLRLFFIFLSALLASLAVVLAGPVAFIGLVAPHIAKNYAGLSHLRNIPFCLLFGAHLTLMADIATRILLSPSEAPLSAVLAFIGVPFLVFLLLSKKRGVVG